MCNSDKWEKVHNISPQDRPGFVQVYKMHQMGKNRAEKLDKCAGAWYNNNSKGRGGPAVEIGRRTYSPKEGQSYEHY